MKFVLIPLGLLLISMGIGLVAVQLSKYFDDDPTPIPERRHSDQFRGERAAVLTQLQADQERRRYRAVMHGKGL